MPLKGTRRGIAPAPWWTPLAATVGGGILVAGFNSYGSLLIRQPAVDETVTRMSRDVATMQKQVADLTAKFDEKSTALEAGSVQRHLTSEAAERELKVGLDALGKRLDDALADQRATNQALSQAVQQMRQSLYDRRGNGTSFDETPPSPPVQQNAFQGGISHAILRLTQ